MKLDHALTIDVRTLTVPELNDARATIGTAKLLMRRNFKLENIIDQLRTYNRRLDVVNDEDMFRQRVVKK